MKPIDGDALKEAFYQKMKELLESTDTPQISNEALSLLCGASLITEAPTIEPEPQWIPCSERLPKEDGQYLITVKYKHVDGYDDIYAEHGDWYDAKWDMFCFGHCGEVEDIIAWMPLPEPYTERREE